MLLEYGASAEVESKAGFTPLHLSAQEGHVDMTNLLLEHKADVNHSSKVRLHDFNPVDADFRRLEKFFDDFWL